MVCETVAAGLGSRGEVMVWLLAFGGMARMGVRARRNVAPRRIADGACMIVGFG